MVSSRTNEEWLQDLSREGERQNAAIQDLNHHLLKAASLTFQRYLGGDPAFTQQEIDSLAEDSAQEALLSVLKHLSEFRGESRFTTWAYKFAVNISLTTARRERWKGVSLDEIEEGETPDGWFVEDRKAPDPEVSTLRNEIWDAISETIQLELTDRQRQVVKWMVFDEIPMDVVVERLGTNRNAVYKLLHDARMKIKTHLEAQGIQAVEAIDLFAGKR